MLFHIFLGGGDGLLDGQSVQVQVAVGFHACLRRVADDAFFGVEALFADVAAFHQRDDGQVEVLGEGVVAAVVRGYCHDGACTVAGKHVVANPDGHCLAGEGVDGVAAREYARHAAVGDALAFGALLGAFQIGVHIGFLFGSGDFCHQFAFGSQHHEGDAEHGVGTGGEDGELQVTVLHLELHFGTFAAAYPVLLCLFQRFGPVYGLQSVQQALCVCRYAEAPLAHLLLHYGETAALADAVHHLVVGKHGAELRTPVHHRFA